MGIDNPVTVVARDQHSVSLYDAITNNLKRTVYVTSGEIMGQPVNNGMTCTITCSENGRTVVYVYEMPQFRWKNKFYP